MGIYHLDMAICFFGKFYWFTTPFKTLGSENSLHFNKSMKCWEKISVNNQIFCFKRYINCIRNFFLLLQQWTLNIKEKKLRQYRGRAKRTRYSGQTSYQGLPWQLQKSYLLAKFFLSASNISFHFISSSYYIYPFEEKRGFTPASTPHASIHSLERPMCIYVLKCKLWGFHLCSVATVLFFWVLCSWGSVREAWRICKAL